MIKNVKEILSIGLAISFIMVAVIFICVLEENNRREDELHLIQIAILEKKAETIENLNIDYFNNVDYLSFRYLEYEYFNDYTLILEIDDSKKTFESDSLYDILSEGKQWVEGYNNCIK